MVFRGLITGASALLFVAGCSASGAGGVSLARNGTAGSANINPGNTGGSSGTDSINTSNGGSTTGGLGGEVCAGTSAPATLVKEPVDIILVLDNSGSMADELQAVEDNINLNFANILESSGVDYRVILISRQRRDARTANAEASTSICVTAPLSGLAMCPAPLPVFSAHFFQYFQKVESTDSLDLILSTYNLRDMRNPNGTGVGWSEWLRPGAKKVFLEMTDDNAALPVDTFLQQLTKLVPANFGTDPMHPSFVFHSIIGIPEKVTDPTAPYQPSEPAVTGKCTGNMDGVANAGPSYQDLSIRTGGLRFPICQFHAYDTVFTKIANDVVTKTQVACDFDIPSNPVGQELDLSKVAVRYTQGSGTATDFGQALTLADCQQGAFYIQNNHIFLCPETCTTVKLDGGAKVDVLFTCQSTIIVK